MRVQMFMPVALAFALLVSAGATADASVTAYGNLGPAGGGSLTSGGLDYGPGFPGFASVAQGFTAGSGPDFLSVTSIKLGLFSATPISRNVGIYEDASGVPGSLKAASSSVTVGSLSVYSFNFVTPVALTPGATYWIIPEPSASQDLFWQNALDGVPTAQNGSGYSFLGFPNGAKSSGNGVLGPWTNRTGGLEMAVSIQVAPVPEPSSVALAGVGIVVAGLSYRRRLRRAAVTKADDAT
jgi:hypothetical protein